MYKEKWDYEDVESIVNKVVNESFASDHSIVAALLRMQFHDCFVTGCDASLLLDGDTSEKKAVANLNIRGFEIIDKAKTALEQACPGIVSCADISIMATRDAVALGGGSNARYEVETGRRDGLTSEQANVDLPGPQIPVSNAIEFFVNKGLSDTDMIVLLGSHTVGVAHCNIFRNRLWNFGGTGSADPSMDPAFVETLKSQCPESTNNEGDVVNLDQNPSSSNVVDNSFYQEIRSNRGILEIDQKLALDPSTTDVVTIMANDGDTFLNLFGKSMVKMGGIGVRTGTDGQTRLKCSSPNTS
ncbi:peroxidase 60-like [Papaver somniferum]|uniref:peroxidase 60-like n=1 Tax=Papaver somniferum TaxID=3469 RepID=UPI000E701068|nr:peroxidase 60-like [Papaver somniferum]